jgi:hemoglobin-like flavoprotein
MNAERKRLVQQTWEMVARDHDRTATVFYDRLFEIDAPARAMFGQTDMAAQRMKFVAMMSDIVARLDLPAALIPSLSSLGRRHREYGVRQIDYDRVREALFGALAAGLGDTFTPDVRDAWEEAYALTASVMMRGAERGTE